MAQAQTTANAPLGTFRMCMQLGGGNLSFTGAVLW